MIDTSKNIIDSRDLIEILADLDLESEADQITATELKRVIAELDENSIDKADDGITLIRWNYFTDYCRELCIDCGYIPRELPEWISGAIDWDVVAANCESDYCEISVFGVTYYYL